LLLYFQYVVISFDAIYSSLKVVHQLNWIAEK
jgi:hypothetical protein